jgi:WD40 repeat protein
VGAWTEEPDGKAGEEEVRDILIWSGSQEKPRFTLQTPKGLQRRILLSPDGTSQAAVASTGVQLWDVVTGQELVSIGASGSPLTDAAFSTDGSRMALTAGQDVLVWDTVNPLRAFSSGLEGVKGP